MPIPGPKCYRRGGPLTVTDANVMVGKLRAATFPKIFGPGRDQPLDEDAVRAAFAELAHEIGDGRTPEEVADGFIRIAVENMANAIKKISVQRGYDVTEYALNCFGSAGGQHACAIADTLGMETVLIHPLSGLLSAYGMGLAPIRASREQSVEAALDADALAGLGRIARAAGGERRAPRSPRRAWRRAISPSRHGRTCATRAPTRRCPFCWRTQRACATPSRPCTASASASCRRRSGW